MNKAIYFVSGMLVGVVVGVAASYLEQSQDCPIDGCKPKDGGCGCSCGGSVFPNTPVGFGGNNASNDIFSGDGGGLGGLSGNTGAGGMF